MNQLLQFWLKNNYRLSEKDAGLFGIKNFIEQVNELEIQGIPLKIEYRRDLDENFPRVYLDEKYREANR